MILRKPFAILIKYFRFIHTILAILSFYLVYRTNLILSFFNEYMATHNSVMGKDLTGHLYSSWMYLWTVIIIVGTVVILGLMVFKQKKVKLYLYNIIVYIATIIIFYISNSIVSSLEVELVDVRTLKAMQDLFNTLFVAQIISMILLAFRATGFNIKKFDFTKDLQELEITDLDNEEFEVNLDLNTDETKRKINRAVRHIKYIYRENKFIILLAITGIIGITSALLYLNFGVYHKVYQKGEAFATNFYTLQLGDSYVSSTDYKGKILSEGETFLMVHLNIRNNTNVERNFESARLILKIDEHTFSHEIAYSEEMFDMGTIYKKQNISQNFTDYTFIYKIPIEFLDRKIELIYTDYNEKEIQMRVKPISLLGRENEITSTLNNSMDFKQSMLGNLKINIHAAEIAPTFKVDYNYCIYEECYPSHEYLKPNLTGNTKKALLKIDGELTKEENENRVSNLYDFINKFGYIEYIVSGQRKSTQSSMNEVKPTKTKLKNIYYLEVDHELMYAEKIDFVFKIRNQTYRYNVK